MARMKVHQDHQIVRKSCILDGGVSLVAGGLARLFQHLVYLIEVEITEQRRDHTSLRNSFLPGRLEDHLEKPHHLIVSDSLRDLREQQIMLNAVKVGAQIKIDDAGLLPDDGLGHAAYRFMGRSLRSVSVRSRLKISFENRFQDQLECSLHHTITDRGYREDSDLCSAFFRYLLLPHAHGLIRVRNQFVPNLLKKTLHSTRFDGLEGDTVNARCPLVFLRHRVGFPKGL